jgi:hypothetical protein
VDAGLKEFYCNSRTIKDKNCFGKHKLQKIMHSDSAGSYDSYTVATLSDNAYSVTNFERKMVLHTWPVVTAETHIPIYASACMYTCRH